MERNNAVGREARRETKTTLEQLRELDRRQGLTRSGRWFLAHHRLALILVYTCYPLYGLARAIDGLRLGHREWLNDRRIIKELHD